MLKYDLDTDQIPLGKISKEQIETASTVLGELSALLEKNATQDEFIAASNHFYMMIPHAFGIGRPVVIKTAEMIQQKRDMLEHLKEIEFTYSLLQESDEHKNPLDGLFEKMNAEISPLDRKSNDYQHIVNCVKQTNCSEYDEERSLKKVMNIFKVERPGEEQRFMQLENRKLLWHGSRLTNFVGILSNGLKITPPEAIQNGASCGRGVYFADAVAKSVSYSSHNENHTGLLLLCEVALGNALELERQNQSIELSNGKNSLKAIGRLYPPSVLKLSDGLEIPCGKLQVKPKHTNRFEFNEYVVYNEAQVKIRYLVQVQFTLDEPDSDCDTEDIESDDLMMSDSDCCSCGCRDSD